jgi:soluble lytic murein transglycosylase
MNSAHWFFRTTSVATGVFISLALLDCTSVRQNPALDSSRIESPDIKNEKNLAAAYLRLTGSEKCPGAEANFEDVKNPKIPKDIKKLFQLRWLAVCGLKTENGQAQNQKQYQSQSPNQISQTAQEGSSKANFTSDALSMAKETADRSGHLRERALRSLLTYFTKSADLKMALDSQLRLARVISSAEEKSRLNEDSLKLARTLIDRELTEIATAQLEKSSPRFISNPGAVQWLSVADDLRKARKLEESLKWYKKVESSKVLDWPTKIKAVEGSRQTLRLMGDRDAAIPFAKKIFELSAKHLSPEAGAKAGIQYARALWTQHQPAEAKAAIEKMIGKYRNIEQRFELRLLAARILEEDKKLLDAVQKIENIPVLNLKDKTVASKISWALGWLEFKQEHFDKAAAAFERLSKTEETSGGKARASFWRAAALAKAGLDTAPDRAWITENDPLGYYHLLNFKEQQSALPAIVTARTDLASRKSELQEDVDITIDWYISMNELEVGRSWVSSLRLTSSPTQAASALARLGSHQTLFASIASMTPGERRQLLQTRPELLFPRPYEDLVNKAAKRFSIPPELIYSIMRQESAFDTMVRSPADAFGLMQILPSIAREVAKSQSLPFESYSDLEKPEINIPIGAALLKQLLDKYQNNFVLAVAAYNANEKALSGWLSRRADNDTIRFIEDIPYDETRNYVKLVMRNFIFYQRLSKPDSSISFPDWCLSPLQGVGN